jgi:hypothetical protein
MSERALIITISTKISGNMILHQTPGRGKQILEEVRDVILVVSASVARDTLERDMIPLPRKTSGNTHLM